MEVFRAGSQGTGPRCAERYDLFARMIHALQKSAYDPRRLPVPYRISQEHSVTTACVGKLSGDPRPDVRILLLSVRAAVRIVLDVVVGIRDLSLDLIQVSAQLIGYIPGKRSCFPSSLSRPRDEDVPYLEQIPELHADRRTVYQTHPGGVLSIARQSGSNTGMLSCLRHCRTYGSLESIDAPQKTIRGKRRTVPAS